MKKKILTTLMVLLVCVGFGFAFGGCRDKDDTRYGDENFYVTDIQINYCYLPELEKENLQYYKYEYTIHGKLSKNDLYKVTPEIEFITDNSYKYSATSINITTKMLGNDSIKISGFLFIDYIQFEKGIKLIPNFIDIKYDKIIENLHFY